MDFLDPNSVVKNSGIEEGMSVADFGSGAGHFVLPLAQAVGRRGKVYAVDIRKEMLEVIEGYVRMNGIFQVRATHGDLEQENGSTLNPDTLDCVFCSNILHLVHTPENVIKEVSRVLKTGGRMIILEWEKGSFLSPSTLFTKEQADSMAQRHSFTMHSTLEVGDHHYGVVYVRT